MGGQIIKVYLSDNQQQIHYIAIVSTASSHRLCWMLQQQEGMALRAVQQPVTVTREPDAPVSFDTFFCRSERGVCWLIANHSQHGAFIRELAETDYILRVDGLESAGACTALVQRIRQLPSVTMAAEITDGRLISKLKKI